MKNTFGHSIAVTLFGESHGEAIGAVIDGLAPGIKIDADYIDKKLAERKPTGQISTQRHEADKYDIVSGVINGYTTGSPICIIIKNQNTNSKDYEKIKDTPRPSHADYTAEIKYHGFQDGRGGGHFSGRITAALVAAGAIISLALSSKGIEIGTHISKLHGICDRGFEDIESDVKKLSNSNFPALSDEAGELMKKEIELAAKCGDSVGGVLESAVFGIDAGIGEPWFDTMEGVISHILFSVPGIKGVEFGAGFALSDMYGSEANDAFDFKDNKVITKTNNSGGINGGITNGMPIIVRSAIRPTPSIYKEQETISLSKSDNTTLKIEGRHDPAIIHRARAVVDAVLAIAVADMLALRYGTDFLR